ncbi:MAG: LPS export ABC transporter ATP-binding protein [Deltaproteobacteria bacterium]|nr:LPS export ABC transporter ATP-binding protein [Deltaproteobacteria bacterium]
MSPKTPSEGDSGAALLEVRGLRRRFGRREVLKGLELAVGAGEVVGLLGPNGAGKTTAFRILMGFLAADAGEVRFLGEAIGRLPVHERARRGLGYLPQNPSVLAGLSVVGNVLVVLEERGFKDAKVRAEEALERAGLGHLAGQGAGTLSGGERRRLEIARLLALGPRVALLDEPFAGVDPLAAEDLRGRISGMRADGVAVLLTDHNVPETMRVCDRIHILVDGAVACSGTPEAIRGDPVARRLYLGNSAS